MANRHTIYFIGGGNMASAIIDGMDTSLWHIVVSDVHEEQRRKLEERFKIETVSETASPLISSADVIVLATKPQSFDSVLDSLKKVDLSNKLIVSIMAGVPMAKLKCIGKNVTYVRTMPNLPIMVGHGVTGVYCEDQSSRPFIDKLLGNTSKLFYLDCESDLDKISAISGSGPAYFFAFIEALAKAGQQIGFGQEDAEQMAIHTALGASKMAMQSGQTLSVLQQNVASKGGTTEQALLSFQNNNLDKIVNDATNAALKRAQELNAMSLSMI